MRIFTGKKYLTNLNLDILTNKNKGGKKKKKKE